MSRIKAQRKLHRLGRNATNWRFKGLMLAALDDEVSPRDVAEAWPDPGSPKDYRFLAHNPNADAEAEASEKMVAEPGEDKHRFLKEHVANPNKNAANSSKTLSGKPKTLTEFDDGAIGVHKDEAVARSLAFGTSFEEVDTLFREELRETVIEGAERRKVAREASTVHNAATPRGDLPVSTDDIFAGPVGQGGAIRDDRERYDTVPFDTEKYGVGARVTDEMVDTADIDAIERQIEHVGAGVENTINHVWLNELVDNAGQQFDVGDESAYEALNQAWGLIDEADFTPDTYATHPGFRTAIAEDSRLASAERAGSDEVLRDREYDPLLALDMHAGSSNLVYEGGDNDRLSGGDEDWGYDDGGETGAVVYNRSMLYTVLYAPNGEDIEIKDYDDPVRDLQGVNARIHCDAVWGQERAGARVTLE